MSRPAEVHIAFRTLWRVQNRYAIRTAKAEVTEKRITSGMWKYDRSTGRSARGYDGLKPSFVVAYRVAGEGWVRLYELPADAEVEMVNGVRHDPPIPAHDISYHTTVPLTPEPTP